MRLTWWMVAVMAIGFVLIASERTALAQSNTVAGFNCRDISSTYIQCRWTAYAGATGYTLHESNDGGQTPGTEYSLASGDVSRVINHRRIASWSYRIRASYRGGQTDWTGWTDSSGQPQSSLPNAVAPTVAINAIPSGREGTTVQLGAILSGGTYDGTPTYAWMVSGGSLDSATSATPTWTRPTVTEDGDYTITLTVTARGTGTTAANNTSDTASATRNVRVTDTPEPPPAPAQPAATPTLVWTGFLHDPPEDPRFYHGTELYIIFAIVGALITLSMPIPIAARSLLACVVALIPLGIAVALAEITILLVVCIVAVAISGVICFRWLRR